MSYDIDFRVKVENTDLWVSVHDCEANITWNLREMICKSTGLEWKNEEDNGLVKDIIPAIEHGLEELKTNPDKYKKYESPNGWGTIGGCEHFFETIIQDWEDFRIYRCCNEEILNYTHFWIC